MSYRDSSEGSSSACGQGVHNSKNQADSPPGWLYSREAELEPMSLAGLLEARLERRDAAKRTSDAARRPRRPLPNPKDPDDFEELWTYDLTPDR